MEGCQNCPRHEYFTAPSWMLVFHDAGIAATKSQHTAIETLCVQGVVPELPPGPYFELRTLQNVLFTFELKRSKKVGLLRGCINDCAFSIITYRSSRELNEIGGQNYPHYYGGRDDGFSNTACKIREKLIAFPMSVGSCQREAVTDLPDRVIIKVDREKAVYYGLVTHIVSHP